MQLAQRTRHCPACGRREPGDAQWCGDCGARLAPTDRAVVVPLHDGQASPRPVEQPRRRWGAAAVAVVLVLAAGLLTQPAPSDDGTLLGRLDDATGRSASSPPADDLQLLWRRQVDARSGTATTAPRLLHLGDHVVLGETVVDLRGTRPPGHLPGDVVPSAEGRVVLADADELVLVDAATGEARQRRALPADAAWRPVGASIGWVAGAAVLADADGVLGAVEPDGRVRWVGDPTWRWTPAGDGTDWAVVVADDEPSDRVLVIDGRDGTLQRDVGPAGVVHAPVVLGDTFAWVDPYGGLDRGRGYPVEVQGVRLDGSGRVWAVTDLPPTSGVPQAVRLTSVGPAGLVVAYATTGQATTAVWLDPVDGSRRGQVAVSGAGTTDEGWPLAAAGGEFLAHVDPLRRELRVVDRGGVVRWAVPTGSGEGVAIAGDVVLVRTPPRGTSLQSRLRLLDARTGVLLWDRVTEDTQAQRVAAVVGDDVGITAAGPPAPIGAHAWLQLDTGRRRAAARVAGRVLDGGLAGATDAVLLGWGGTRGDVAVLQLPDGRVVGAAGGPADVTTLLAPPRAGLPPSAVRADAAAGVVVGAAAVTVVDAETGARRWRRSMPAALRPDATLLLEQVVVVLGWDGTVRALDRRDGAVRWTGPTGVTATTAGGDEVVLGLATGEVVVLAPDGRERQRLQAGHAAVEDVAVVGGRVLVTVGGDLVAFGSGAAFIEPVDRVEVP